MINQVQGSGISTEQQKKTWLINWYFANDPMGSIYLATLRNQALVASYHPDSNRDHGLLYGSNFTNTMENCFIKIKTIFGQSMLDQRENVMTKCSSGAIHCVDRLISKRVARDLNLDNQITSNEYVIETPEEVAYLFSSYQLERGAKRYELSNHLGNVLTVISDKKTAICTGNTFNYFAAERISATDYSPFGAPLAGRSWQASEYRFSFNGKEADKETYGDGNEYDYGFRVYNPRLGKFLSVDPLAKEYPFYSPYHFAGNSPIKFKDLDGREVEITGTASDVMVKLLKNHTGLDLTLDANGMLTYATYTYFDPFDNSYYTVPKINNPNSSMISTELREQVLSAIDGGFISTIKIIAMTRKDIKLLSKTGKDEVFFDQFPGQKGADPVFDNVVDVSDFIASDSEPSFTSAMLGHVITERGYRAMGYDIAHNTYALEAEGDIIRESNPLATNRNEDLSSFWENHSSIGTQTTSGSEVFPAGEFDYGSVSYTTYSPKEKHVVQKSEVKMVEK